jgi:hypothetical protein
MAIVMMTKNASLLIFSKGRKYILRGLPLEERSSKYGDH